MQKRDPMELNSKVLKCKNETDQWKRSKSKWKNEVICLVIKFTLRVIVIKMSKIAHFLFYADERKTWVNFLAKQVSAYVRSYWVLSKNGTVNALWC